MSTTIDTVRIIRTETIIYARDFTLDELAAAGKTPDALESVDDVRDALQSWDPALDAVRDYVFEETERHGDVQGSSFEVVPA